MAPYPATLKRLTLSPYCLLLASLAQTLLLFMPLFVKVMCYCADRHLQLKNCCW